MKIITVVGARPQFIKAAALSQVLRKQHQEVLIHTGQHYDLALSQIFFDELSLPEPDYNLQVGSGSHSAHMAAMLPALETVYTQEQPDAVMVYGDTNSTLAGAMTAAQLHIPVFHVEAGLRSFVMTMPEEINRRLTDHLSALLFCPTPAAVKNLAYEGITAGVCNVGDVMYELLLKVKDRLCSVSTVLKDFDLNPGEYYVVTVHRPVNADDVQLMGKFLSVLAELDMPIIFPVHPRTKKTIDDCVSRLPGGCGNIRFIEPLGYGDMLTLTAHACKVLTDSGGLQKEAFFSGTPCLILRDETEWVETVESGWNVLVGMDREKISRAIRAPHPEKPADLSVFGDGNTSGKIVEEISKFFK